MLTGFAIIGAFSVGMWVMHRLTLDYEDRIINAVKGREYEQRRRNTPRPTTTQRQPQARPAKPMLDEDDYDKLMREGRVVKRR